MRANVEELLKNYQDNKRKICFLHFRLQQFTETSDVEIIKELTLSTPQGERIISSFVADKTSTVALLYRDKTNERNEEIFRELYLQYRKKREEQELLEHGIDSLDPKLKGVLTDRFIHEMIWADIANKYYVSQSMVKKYCKKGIAELANLYESLAQG
ncbi:sigma-70 family RNA polymerase sigma factor [Desulfosporosinus sp. Sb-LF]|uniref:sigma-70 family RNA polymerase sigma factor n=1 Tax=Desulfosporosinus sp. Sb-LF TaxID=2560027 RepID=UPI00107F5853|nr:sigma-70 family RNA polymerase sigma factor [Desulfosporosinus sp. Sb-LF]TGE31441.1 sigma-70 family RNA polymerase sigma factor [Desulfosporosinus sp. Sb-LF]